jgi:hypothetical protein
MSKSYKGEARAQARADQQRRAARAAKHADNFLEWGDSICESNEPSKNHAKRVDGRKSLTETALDSRLARLSH